MSTTNATAAPALPHPVETTVTACSCRVYEAECALHAAHQSGVDAWITAAGDKLHQALADYLEAVAHSESSHR